jgi:uncharacterized membrane protein
VNEKGRLEAFSDGVMAIAITLLTLDLVVPTRQELLDEGKTLAQALGALWPSFAAYVVSFLIIGIIWVNHHTLFGMLARVERVLLFVNLLLLMLVAVIPFPTRLLAEYLTAANRDSHIAAAVYSTTMLVTAIVYTGLFALATRRADLLLPGVDADAVRRSLPRFGLGVGVYAVTVLLSFVSAPLTLATHFVIAVYYVFDQTGARRNTAA